MSLARAGYLRMIIWLFFIGGIFLQNLIIPLPWRGWIAAVGLVSLAVTLVLTKAPKEAADQRASFYLRCLVIVILGMAAELVGVTTGFPFGSYLYTTTLQPQILGVPVAIGASWLLVVLSASGIAEHLFRGNGNGWAPKMCVRTLVVGLLCLLFDLSLEPAARCLDYWLFDDGHAPLINYVAWFVLGCIFYQFVRADSVIADSSGRSTTDDIGVEFDIYIGNVLYFLYHGVC